MHPDNPKINKHLHPDVERLSEQGSTAEWVLDQSAGADKECASTPVRRLIKWLTTGEAAWSQSWTGKSRKRELLIDELDSGGSIIFFLMACQMSINHHG